MKRVFICLCVALALLVPLGRARAEQAKAPAVNAASALVLDVSTTRVLAAQNAHARLPMASTTKIMTALLAVECGELSAAVTVSGNAYGTEGSSIYLELGEEMSLQDLLYGLMLKSGNDAAVAIAEHIGGSVENFVRMMNDRAKSLGCVNTHFANPNGLPDDEHYTTAFDLARIAACALRNPEFRTIVNTTYYQTTTGNHVRTFKNSNKLLWEYEGTTGVKTGYTKTAGRCLVFAAQKDGFDVVGVVLNCPDMWNDSVTLMNYVFGAYNMQTICRAGEVVRTAAVERGDKNSLNIVAQNDILLPIEKGMQEDVVLRVDCPRTIEAPVDLGQTVGTLEVYLDGRLMAGCDLITAEEIRGLEFPDYLRKVLRAWTD